MYFYWLTWWLKPASRKHHQTQTSQKHHLQLSNVENKNHLQLGIQKQLVVSNMFLFIPIWGNIPF